ncbi:MAG: DPP IV N-terminal domain-containing protein [Bacteroidales bacterium]|nr:DPP IV N-terminal domain-containing protein [Bacteroidales bacterium]
MKRILSIIALATPLVLNAQTGVYTTHPANPEGRLLTTEETELGRHIRPASVSASWKDSDTFTTFKDGKWIQENLLTGEISDYSATCLPEGFPKDAGNITRSDDGTFAYTIGQSLYIFDNGPVSVAVSENPDITYGQSVSRNEFGIGEGIFWAPDGSKLAFYRKDESKVTDFPLLDITTRTGSLKSIKYPMNGMDSERISLGIYDRASGKTVWCDVNEYGDDRYLTNISWSPDSRNIFIQVVDRSQKHMKLNMYRAADGSFARTILTEDDSRFVEPLDPLRFIKGTYSFIYRTDIRDGYRNLYLCDTLGTVRRLTGVDADVEYLGNDGRFVYYTSAEVSPVENHLFRIEVRIPGAGKAKGRADAVAKARLGKPVRLTSEEGWHTISLNEDCTRFIDNYSSFNVPRVMNIVSADGKLIRNLITAEDPLKDYKTGKALLGTVKSADGKYDNWYRMFLPTDFDPAKKYPVIIYVYGGPHSQMVRNSWLGQVRMWEMLMAQKGYIVYVQDNRGTQNRGAEYEKAIHRHCGQAEMADQMVGVNMLKSLPFVDSDRIGVHGWSYGGFMTISLMTNHPETFKVGVAGGPVIDWKWYEIMYGERYMDTEATNPDGFAQTSLLNNVKNLKGKLLICQGAIDNTVLWQHSLSFVQRCIEENVQLDYFPYPRSEHNVFGSWRVHLMDKVTNYFDDYL